MEAAKKPRCPNWTEKDRVLLITNMQPYESVLFRKYKGPLREAQVKADAWKEIVSKFNAQADMPRSLDQLKKQYDNVKTRAKQKYDEIKRPKTGGGPRPVSPSASQKLLLEQMSGRPNLSGLPMAYDTEDPCLLDFVSTTDMDGIDFNPIETSKDINELLTATGGNVRIFDIPIPHIPAPEPELVPVAAQESIAVEEFPPLLKQVTKKRGKKPDLEEDVLSTEKRRALAEIRKINLECELIQVQKEHEIEIFELRKNMLLAKTKYYQNKL